MKLVIENFKTGHYKLLTEMAKVLQFEIVEAELTENEYLLAEMEKVKDEPIATAEEVAEFKTWLKINK